MHVTSHARSVQSYSFSGHTCSVLLVKLLIHYLLVGCGTSCIYPLLGAKVNGWHFTASEVDSTSTGYAMLNVNKNSLQDKIQGIFFSRFTGMIFATWTKVEKFNRVQGLTYTVKAFISLVHDNFAKFF